MTTSLLTQSSCVSRSPPASRSSTYLASPAPPQERDCADIDEIVGVLNILIPVPGGDFIIGAVENWLFGKPPASSLTAWSKWCGRSSAATGHR